MILAIDPGPEQSAFVLYDPATRAVGLKGKWRNDMLLNDVRRARHMASSALSADVMVVEMIASYGMVVGREVFETCVIIGKLIEAWGGAHERMYRGTVKLHICGSMRAKDANVRQALLDAFDGKDKAVGNKKQPGPLYGVSGDIWAALGVAVTYAEIQAQARNAA